ncbi:RidA family protein [Rhodococcus sp. IEGM 1381]|uniref:RidA family protein n=1 Tax=Rhodococcus sp. IEGM 1381 TaxID=3047085 RepID=UPI0024B7E791|nr:RidA family protein [Rhodococcus sp. IEGM 1381]MDI9896887.1 RidA family protein [Rhodococcus sp. IEGM 1381]
MTIERINPSTLGKQSGFSHAVRADNAIYLAGQTALDVSGSIVDGGIVAQFRQSMTNLLTALEAAGGGPENLVDVTIYLLDIPEYQANGREIGQIWRELAGTEYPAMAGIGVTSLWQPEALIEIQAVAHI